VDALSEEGIAVGGRFPYYQFRDDFIMDPSAAQATFGLKPTPWEEVVAATVSG
jgi:hypothetical protein